MFAKAAVEYTDHAGNDDEQCRHCSHFLEPRACEIVKGIIQPGGWCLMWTNKQKEVSDARNK